MQARQGPHDYYRMREAQEREMAAQTADESARQIHLNLADAYRGLAASAQLSNEADPDHPTLIE